MMGHMSPVYSGELLHDSHHRHPLNGDGVHGQLWVRFNGCDDGLQCRDKSVWTVMGVSLVMLMRCMSSLICPSSGDDRLQMQYEYIKGVKNMRGGSRAYSMSPQTTQITYHITNQNKYKIRPLPQRVELGLQQGVEREDLWLHIVQDSLGYQVL